MADNDVNANVVDPKPVKDDATPPKTALQKWLGYSKSVASSTLLLVVYLVVLFIVFLGLSAHEVQTQITSANIDGRSANLYDVLRDTPEISKVALEVEELKKERDTMIKSVRELNIERMKAKAVRDVPAIAAWQYYSKLGLTFSEEIRQDPAKGMKTFSEKRGATNPKIPSEKIFTPEMEKVLQEYELAHAEVIRINRDRDRRRDLRDQFSKLVSLKNEELKTLTARSLPQLRAELEFFVYNETSGVVSKAFELFGFVTTIKGDESKATDEQQGVIHPKFLLIGLPSVMLMIFIAIIGGALGGLIRVTETYLSGSKDPDERVLFYIARPLFGMITALTVFVLLKSGVLLVSGVSSGGGSTTSLNAYFVAFASIVAGLMSENAVDTLRSAGNGLLSKNTIANASYASGVVDMMEEKKKKIEDLYDYFIVPRSTVDDWLKEKVKVPSHAKQIIAAWLGSSTRVLFSDEPAESEADIKKVKK